MDQEYFKRLDENLGALKLGLERVENHQKMLTSGSIRSTSISASWTRGWIPQLNGWMPCSCNTGR